MTKWYYPAVIGIFCLLCHSFGWEYFYFSTITLVAVYICIFNRNGLRLIPLLLFSLIALSRVNNSYIFITDFDSFITGIGGIIYLTILGIILFAALLYLFVFKLVKECNARKALTKSKLLLGLIVLAISYFAGGLFTAGYTLSGLWLAASLSAVLLSVFVYFVVTVEWDRASFEFVCECATVMAAVIAVQMGLLYLTEPTLRYLTSSNSNAAKSMIFLGWSPSNLIGIKTALILPFVLYRMYNAKQPIVYFVVVCAALFAIIYTFSRNAVMFAVPMFLAVSVFALLRAKGKKTLWVAYSVTAAIGIITLIAFWTPIINSLDFFNSLGIEDRGRFDLYRAAVEHFFSAPIFGVGFGYLTGETERIGYSLYHNHILQFLASMGIVGLAAYGFHRAQTVKLLIKKIDRIKIFIFISIVMFVLTASLDNTLFNPGMLVIYALVMVMLECHNRIGKDNSSQNKEGEQKNATE
ncbi:MAG: O-antigen ligase family protein [Firmicutes bacterium]|nr:O-antigen ligase family protein [Bacillota bacterium]